MRTNAGETFSAVITELGHVLTSWSVVAAAVKSLRRMFPGSHVDRRGTRLLAEDHKPFAR